MTDTEDSNNEFNENTVEVIDLLNEDLECNLLLNGHDTNTIGAMGGRINDEFIYCGGSIEEMYSGVTKDCLVLGKGYPEDPLHSPLDLTIPEGRSTSNGGVILPNSTLFICGMSPLQSFVSRSCFLIKAYYL